MKKRLWIVKVFTQAYVLAETEADAAAAHREIEKWENTRDVIAYPWAGEELDGWDDKCYVYGNPGVDITLRKAKEIDAVSASESS